jgi:hypothetical protein
MANADNRLAFRRHASAVQADGNAFNILSLDVPEARAGTATVKVFLINPSNFNKVHVRTFEVAFSRSVGESVTIHGTQENLHTPVNVGGGSITTLEAVGGATSLDISVNYTTGAIWMATMEGVMTEATRTVA